MAAPQPDSGDKRDAKRECTTLRGGTDATREAFLTVYRNFGTCVSAKAREEAREEKTAHTNAAWQCKTERAGNAASAAERESGAQTFRTTYGTENANYENAFAKCVSRTGA